MGLQTCVLPQTCPAGHDPPPLHLTPRSPSLPPRDLEGLGLGGELSPALASLTSMMILNLEGNNLTGSLPEEWAFPDMLSLNLANNALTGTCSARPCEGRRARGGRDRRPRL